MDEQLTRMMQFIQNMQGDGAIPKKTGNNGIDMLTAMRPMLPYGKQRMIDLLIKIMEMQEIWNEMREPDGL